MSHNSDQKQMYDDYKEKQRRKYVPDDLDNCAYVYNQAQLMRCGRTREQHQLSGIAHDFVDPTGEVSAQPAPETGGEWSICRTRPRLILDEAGRILAEVRTEQHAAQIVADHNRSKSLATAATCTVERLHDLPRYLSDNGMGTLGGIVGDCLNELYAASSHHHEGGRG